MTGPISKMKSSTVFMLPGAAVLIVIAFAALANIHATVAAEETALTNIRVASAEERVSPETRNKEKTANGTEARQPTTSFFPDETKLMIGDRLKVSIYEKVGSGTESSSVSALSSLVEHTEMSGEYTVQTDGGIFLPFIGHMDVIGKSSKALQQALESKIATVFKGHAVSTVRLMEREPIYVTGSVSQPGTFKYAPGMIVLNAIILAGTMPAGQPNGQNLDLMRMTEHLQQSDVKLANLLAQRDVLVALRDGKKPTASRPLVNLVGGAQVSNYITAAKKLAELKEEKYNSELQALAADRAMLEKQRTILTISVNDALAGFNHTKDRMNAVLKLRRTGITTDNTYYQAIGDVDLAQARLNDLKTALAKLEAQIVAVDEREKTVVVDANIVREQALSDLQTSIAEAAVTRDTLRPTLAFSASGDQRADTTQYIIMRRTGGGLEKIEADRLTLLQPGDIVEVMRTVRPFLDASAGSEK